MFFFSRLRFGRPLLSVLGVQMEPSGVRAEPRNGWPTQSEHRTAPHIILRKKDWSALCTPLQTVRNGDESFDTYLAKVMISRDEKRLHGTPSIS